MNNSATESFFVLDVISIYSMKPCKYRTVKDKIIPILHFYKKTLEHGEKFAREKFLMKKDNGDIFIIKEK